MRQAKKWSVLAERPEETGSIFSYYTRQTIEDYARSGGMRRAQEKIAHRILELLDVLGVREGRLLDLGCGVGYTATVYKQAGFSVVGLDVLPSMIEKARTRGLRVVQGDMTKLADLFSPAEFDAVVSASALQWLKERRDLVKVAAGVQKILKPGGVLVVQFYPQSEDELMRAARVFKKHGFYGQIVVDAPDTPKKRVIYLAMQKQR